MKISKTVYSYIFTNKQYLFSYAFYSYSVLDLSVNYKAGKMINSVNSLPAVQNIGMQNPYVIGNPQIQSNNNFIPDANLNGMNALSSYNRPAVSKSAPKTLKPDLPTILMPEVVRTMKGDRIYSSGGVLNSIINKGEKYTTVYKTDVLAPDDVIGSIEYFDNATGKLIRSQENLNIIEKGKLPQTKMIEITNYCPETGKPKSCTIYEDGKPYSVSEYEFAPDGTKILYAANLFNDSSMIIERNEDKQTSKEVLFDRKGNVERIITRDFANFSCETEVYENGIIKEKHVEKRTPIPNTTGKNPLVDSDIIPGQPYIINYDPKQLDGEKEYYSNGVLEAVRTNTANGLVTHYFSPDGNLRSIEDSVNKKSVYFLPEFYSINEEIGQGISKSTAYNKEGTIEVSVVNKNNQSEKTAFYSKDGKLSAYIDIDKDGNRMMMNFDKQGNLISVR